jgi:WD40 repeat protein
VLSVAFGPGGKSLASASAEQLVKVWGLRPGGGAALLWQRKGLGARVAFGPDCLAAADSAGGVTVCRPADGAALGSFPAHPGRQVFGLAWHASAGEALLASGADHDGVKVWRVGRTNEKPPRERRGVEVWRSRKPGDKPAGPRPGGLGPWRIRGVAFSPEGRRLAASDVEGKVEVFDAQSGELLFALEEPGRAIPGVAFSPDGRYLAAALWRDCLVKVWDCERRAELCTLSGHAGRVHCVAFSPRGERLASAGEDGAVKVWDLETEREVLTLRGHRGPVNGLAFSPDGWRLASAGFDGTVRVWDATPLEDERWK